MSPTSDSSRFITFVVFLEVGLAAIAMYVGPWFGADVPNQLASPIEGSMDLPFLGPHVLGHFAAGSQLGFCAQTCFGTIPFLVGLAWIIRSNHPPFVRLNELVTERLVPILKPLPISSPVCLGVAAGFGEEVFFRGFLQQALCNYFTESKWLMILLVAILFGLLHFVTPTYAALATIAGVYLGWMHWSTENIWLAVGVHGLYDVVALVWLAKFHAGSMENKNTFATD